MHASVSLPGVKYSTQGSSTVSLSVGKFLEGTRDNNARKEGGVGSVATSNLLVSQSPTPTEPVSLDQFCIEVVFRVHSDVCGHGGLPHGPGEVVAQMEKG